MNWFSLTGLIVDIIGVAIVFFNGIPFDVRDLSGYTVIKFTEKGKKKFDRQTRLSKFGLALLFIGFILQLIGTIYPVGYTG